MDRTVGVKLFCVLRHLTLEVGADLGQLLDPLRAAIFREVEFEFLYPVDHLTQDELGIADQRNFRRHLPSDATRRRVDLDVFGLVVPGLGAPEVLAAPEAEAQREHDVGAPGEGLLERAPNRQRMLLGHRTLASTPRIDRDGGKLDELAQLGPGLRPEYSVAAGDQRWVGCDQQRERAVDLGRVAGRADVVDRETHPARALLLVFVMAVQNVLRNLDQRYALRRRDRLAKSQA